MAVAASRAGGTLATSAGTGAPTPAASSRPGAPAGNQRASQRAAAIAAIVPQIDANRVVGRMPAGSADPAAARSAITLVGSSVMLEVLMARNSAIESVAVP